MTPPPTPIGQPIPSGSENLGSLGTETPNPATAELDTLSTAELLRVMNSEDATVADAVRAALPQITEAVELITRSLREGGRLVYVGAGTSGRLGVLDAVECPPTFNTAPERVVGLIAGGPEAFVAAVEGAEDDPQRGAADVAELRVGQQDTVVGLAASGRTPYVLGALSKATELGAATVAVSCNAGAATSAVAQVAIEVQTGAEVLTGSTRLKAGTAQKMVCNMLSTAAMVGIGKAYRNLMVDMRPTNAKLADRAVRIVREATGADDQRARDALAAADQHAKLAIVMVATNSDADTGRALLARAEGNTRAAITS
ncbi:N-acetylmuramic acid 6-phosphate etherase [Dermacoccaceae bacterium W4C1]